VHKFAAGSRKIKLLEAFYFDVGILLFVGGNVVKLYTTNYGPESEIESIERINFRNK
jgi:hypothetical protein